MKTGTFQKRFMKKRITRKSKTGVDCIRRYYVEVINKQYILNQLHFLIDALDLYMNLNRTP